MNSRTSFPTMSRLAPNSRLIASTMSGSDVPLSRSSKILDPTGFRLNICPCLISSTIAPSWPCVLRTPFDTLYKGCPTPFAFRIACETRCHLQQWKRHSFINSFGKESEILNYVDASTTCISCIGFDRNRIRSRIRSSRLERKSRLGSFRKRQRQRLGMGSSRSSKGLPGQLFKPDLDHRWSSVYHCRQLMVECLPWLNRHRNARTFFKALLTC